LTGALGAHRIRARAGERLANERGFVLLLRHASAGERLSSAGVDRFRRLDEVGRATARRLVWAFADREITKVVSSPLVRCLESVVPLAESRHLVVESRWELEPDVALDDLLTLLADLPDTTLACTHREVFEKLLGWDVTCDKGGAWVLERSGSELVPTLYLEPPAAVGAAERYTARTA
jgi:phosphohistidine phosphatase SixA